MTKRYQFLSQQDIYTAFNQVRNAFLAAKDGNEVDKVIDTLLYPDEKIKAGRRLLIANLLIKGLTFDQIAEDLKVGKNTILKVAEQLDKNQEGYELITKRYEKIEKQFKQKAYEKTGPSKVIFKKTYYTGFKRKDVKR